MGRVIGNIFSDLLWGIAISSRAMVVTKRLGHKDEVFYFRSVWRSNRILNNSKSLFLHSIYESDSIFKKLFCITPSVYYDKNGYEVLRYNDHTSLQNHEIVFPDGYKIIYDHRKFDFTWRENEISYDKSGLSLECEY